MKVQCSYCLGSGYVKQKSEICDSCNGIKCIYCKSTGFKKLDYGKADEMVLTDIIGEVDSPFFLNVRLMGK